MAGVDPATAAERPPDSPVVVVGASLAGVAVVDELRSRGFAGRITLVGAENEPPYDRPPLSKQFLTSELVDEAAALRLKDPAWYRDNGVDLRTGVRATGLCRRTDGRLEVALGDGDRVHGGDVVIATGARPRAVPGPAFAADPERVHYLRDLTDATALRDRLRRGPGHLVVIGAGFIGLEVAGAAGRLGWDVTVLDAAEGPLRRVLPPAVAEVCLRTRPAGSVRIECGVTVSGFTGSGDTRTVVLSDGRELSADCVVVGVGVRPNTEWLAGSEVAVDDGVVCDGQGRTSVERVWAAGDVARWPNAATGLHTRVEQWQAAKEQGRVVAGALLGDGAVWQVPPYFWTELFGQRVQMVGHCDPDMDVHVAEGGSKALAVLGRGDLCAVVAVDNPRWLALGKRLLADRIPFARARQWADDQVAHVRDRRKPQEMTA